MSYQSDSVNVYAEAKSEYTRQLCQNLGPAIQIYFLDLLKVAKEKDTDPRRMLWNFQALLQEIPDWNQDKVLRETEKIQKESNCDYLEELITAVFIAHTKVLSAIRITTKQKKLQITIPKVDHFLHRTLRETGRLLWGNAFLFAEQGSPIDRQKNMRQVESLIQEGIQQSIRSLLPVKTILREYLNDEADGEAEEEEDSETTVKQDEKATEKAEEDAVQIESKQIEEDLKKSNESGSTDQNLLATVPEPTVLEQKNPDILEIPTKSITSHGSVVNIIKEQTVPSSTETETKVANEVISGPAVPTLVVETEPTVSFTNMDTIFDSENPEGNEITGANHEEEEEIVQVNVLDAPPEPLDNFEDLESSNSIEFEEIA